MGAPGRRPGPTYGRAGKGGPGQLAWLVFMQMNDGSTHLSSWRCTLVRTLFPCMFTWELAGAAWRLRRSCEKRQRAPRQHIPLRKSKQMPFSWELTATMRSMLWLNLHAAPRLHWFFVKSKQICCLGSTGAGGGCPDAVGWATWPLGTGGPAPCADRWSNGCIVSALCKMVG